MACLFCASLSWDGSKTISFSEAIVLGGALSINNIAGGFDAGVTNLNLWLTATISGVFSFICISGFTYVGKRFLAEYLGKWATVIAGLLLIFLLRKGDLYGTRKSI